MGVGGEDGAAAGAPVAEVVVSGAVGLRWEPHGGGAPVVAWRGLDAGNFLVASVARYDTYGCHWRAFVALEPLPGRYATAEEAMAAAEEAAELLPPRAG